jgi:hypothetical protein
MLFTNPYIGLVTAITVFGFVFLQIDASGGIKPLLRLLKRYKLLLAIWAIYLAWGIYCLVSFIILITKS